MRGCPCSGGRPHGSTPGDPTLARLNQSEPFSTRPTGRRRRRRPSLGPPFQAVFPEPLCASFSLDVAAGGDVGNATAVSRGRLMGRLAPSFVLFVLAATRAAAVDVTTCGQVIPPHEAGVLVADLDCSGQPAGSDGVVLGNQSSLDLQGHSLVGPPHDMGPGSAVRCSFGAIECKPGK